MVNARNFQTQENSRKNCAFPRPMYSFLIPETHKRSLTKFFGTMGEKIFYEGPGT